MRRGVTLVELLVAVSIIAVLGTAILGVASVAMDTARESRTKQTVAKLHSLISERYGQYSLRRVKLDQNVQKAIESIPANTPQQRQERDRLKHLARLYALREMVMSEMPDRWSDVTLAPFGQGYGFYAYCDAPVSEGASLPPRYGVGATYLRDYDRLRPSLENQSAECLYLTIMNACAESEPRAIFQEREIGDTDGDGALEFLDAWGKPISWLRWAPGFESDAQLNANDLLELPVDEKQNAVNGDHDDLDVFRVDSMAFRLQPLIYSNGSDGDVGLWDPDEYVAWVGLPQPYDSPAQVVIPLRPLVVHGTADVGGPGNFLGTVMDRSEATDNIHSHLIGTRL